MGSPVEGWWCCPPHDVRVELVSADSLEDSDAKSGEADTDAQAIKVFQGAIPTKQVELLLHEMVHLWLSHLPLSEEMEETVATVLGRTLTSWLQENPDRVMKLVEMVRRPGRKETNVEAT